MNKKNLFPIVLILAFTNHIQTTFTVDQLHETKVINMITLKKLDQEFAICKLTPSSTIPDWIWQSSWYAITKTADELSLVCEQGKVIPDTDMQQENGWKCLQVVGQLDFSLTGILSSIAQPLADNKISIFAISTYDTDYILVKKEYFEDAQKVLQNNNFIIV